MRRTDEVDEVEADERARSLTDKEGFRGRLLGLDWSDPFLLLAERGVGFEMMVVEEVDMRSDEGEAYGVSAWTMAGSGAVMLPRADAMVYYLIICQVLPAAQPHIEIPMLLCDCERGRDCSGR